MTTEITANMTHSAHHPLPLSAWSTMGDAALQQWQPNMLELAETMPDLDLEQVKRNFLPIVEQIASSFTYANKPSIPFIFGITGGVAVGKTTCAKIIQLLLRQRLPDLNIKTINIDGYLLPNKTLEKQGNTDQKGFPKTYQWDKLWLTLQQLKQHQNPVYVPHYSHETYDVTHQEQLETPVHLVILEGLHLLYPSVINHQQTIALLQDIIDFTLYLDTDADVAFDWFINRFLRLRAEAKSKPGSFYWQFATMSTNQAKETAKHYWDSINAVNLQQHIQPCQHRADMIWHLNPQHDINNISVRNEYNFNFKHHYATE